MGIFWFLLLSILQTLIVITGIDCLLMGVLRPCFAKKSFSAHSLTPAGGIGDAMCNRTCGPGVLLITSSNRIDLQTDMECSAYASAFVLRHFGKEASGAELYREITGRRGDGTVYPKGVKKLLLRHGLKATYCTGNLNALKREIGRGNPPIVLVRTYPGKKWLHYVPVVGYDESHFFLADSLAELTNCVGNGYNRKVSYEEFKRLWNTSLWKMPLYRHTFFRVSDSCMVP